MTHHEYALYSRLFDAMLALRADGVATTSFLIQLHGDVGGAALRTWAARHRLDVIPVIGDIPELGTWTKLEMTLPGDLSCSVVAHLDDNLNLNAPRQLAIETEIPL